MSSTWRGTLGPVLKQRRVAHNLRRTFDIGGTIGMSPVVLNVTIDGRAAEMTVESLSGALALVFGDAALQFGKAWGDMAAFYRFRKSLEIAEKVKKLRETYPTAPEFHRPLSEGEGIRAIEVASLEDDGDVQDLWAALLRNSSDKRTRVTVEKTYVEILKALSGPEALLMKAIYRAPPMIDAFDRERRKWAEGKLRETKGDRPGDSVSPSKVSELLSNPYPPNSTVYSAIMGEFSGWRSHSRDIRLISINDLVRLQLIRTRSSSSSMFKGTGKLYIDEYRRKSIDYATPEGLKELEQLIQVSTGAIDADCPEPAEYRPSDSYINLAALFPELRYTLTPLGNRLMRACLTPPHAEVSIDLAGG